MKYCIFCGASIDDAATDCPQCGANLSNEATPTPETPNKKKSKKPLLLTLSIIAVLAIGFCVWFFVFRKSSGNAEDIIRKQTKEYVNAIEDLDVEKIVELTIPKDLLKKLAVLLAESGELDTSILGIDNAESLEEDFDEFYDSTMSFASVYIKQYIQKYDIKADVSEYKITSVEKFDIDEILKATYDAGEIDADELKEANDLIHSQCKEYGIDLNEIYNVYAIFDASLSASGETFNASSDMLREMLDEELGDTDLPFQFYDEEGGVAVFVAYKYDGKYYMLPSLGIFAPSLIRYVEKSKKSSDILTAKSIDTAVEAMLGNENAYDYFTTTGAYICYPVTEEGLSEMPDEYATELKQNLCINNDYPRVRYTKDGQTHFSFMVDDCGIVYVYVADDYSESAWEIYPDLDYLYHY